MISESMEYVVANSNCALRRATPTFKMAEFKEYVVAYSNCVLRRATPTFKMAEFEEGSDGDFGEESKAEETSA
jgi:hypothetical protein